MFERAMMRTLGVRYIASQVSMRIINSSDHNKIRLRILDRVHDLQLKMPPRLPALTTVGAHSVLLVYMGEADQSIIAG